MSANTVTQRALIRAATFGPTAVAELQRLTNGADSHLLEDTVAVDDLLPTDIFLYRGRGLLSWLIRHLDGTDASHAAIYLGNRNVGEALAQGVVSDDIAVSYAGHDWVLVRRLKIRPLPPAQPVLDVAQGYLTSHVRYAYHQLLLLSFLLITRKVVPTHILAMLVRKVLDGATAFINGLLGGGKQVMICSEFVYRCYDEAIPKGPYDLHINEGSGVLQSAGGTNALFASGRLTRGIHPESILAWVSQQSESPLRPAVLPLSERTSLSRSAPQSNELSDDQLKDIEQLVSQYQAELQDAQTPSVEVVLPQEDAVRDAVKRFADALFALSLPQTRALQRQKLNLAADSQPLSSMAYLLSAAADFVTPGDLFRAESLETRGKLEQP